MILETPYEKIKRTQGAEAAAEYMKQIRAKAKPGPRGPYKKRKIGSDAEG